MKKKISVLIVLIMLSVSYIPNFIFNTVYAAGTADDIIMVATGELGTRETGNNIVKYWDELGYSSMQGQSWCAAFIVWCARQAGIGSDVIPTSFSCYNANNSMKNWFSNRGRYYERGTTTPQRGDLVIFKYANDEKHIGLVTGSDSSNVYTIEGNTSNMVNTRTYSLNDSEIHGYCRPAYVAVTPPTNVYLNKNQIWYDIQDTIELTPHADNATNFYMSVRKQDTWEEVISTALNGTYSVSAASLGYGDYYAWITASNSAGGTDSQGITFSIVGAPGFSDVSSARDTYIIEDNVSISVSTICAKGQVIGIDRYDENSSTRLITEQCDPTFTIPASTLGTGNYYSYFSVYNGSGSIDTTGITFKIVDKSNLGENFYAYIHHQGTDTYLTNQSNNIAGEKLSGDDRQLWNFIRQSDGSYIIRSVYDDGYMDVWGNYTDDGTNIYSCATHTGAENQRFFIYRMYDAYYIRPAHTTDHMIDIGSDLNLKLWGRGDDWSPQEFDIIRLDVDGVMPEDLGNDFYAYIQHQTSGLYLTNDYSNNNNINAQELKETNNQKWHFVKCIDGSYTIENVHDNSYMDVTDASIESGTNVFANNTYTGNINQRFFIHYMYDAYYINPVYTSDNMIDMSSETFNIELWGRGQDWFAQEFNIIKTTLIEPTPTPETYTITFYSNGGTINSGNITSYTSGEGIALPTDVTKEGGYIFGGWYDNAECTGTAVTAISETDTGNKTYYAKWIKIEPVGYEIRFVNYDGMLLQSKIVTAGDIPSYTETTPEKAQDECYTYTFSGWSPVLSAANSNMIYTAQFTKTARIYGIEYNTDGGNINNDIVTSYTYGIGTALPTDVTKEGYTFEGWYDNAECTGTAVTTISETDTGNKTYYAKWTKNNPAEYLISFVNYDNSILQSSYYPVGETPKYYGPIPTRPADSEYTYTFIGWEPVIREVNGIATYTANYEATPIEYMYSIKYDDDSSCVIVTAAEPGIYTMIFAVYDTDGTLISVKTRDINFDTPGLQEIPMDHTLKRENNIKIMLWDSISGMTPKCEYYSA